MFLIQNNRGCKLLIKFFICVTTTRVSENWTLYVCYKIYNLLSSMPVTINCNGSQTIYSGISAHFSCKCYVIYIAEKRKYANINEQIFEKTGTSNS